MNKTTRNDLAEEVQARKEAEAWRLQDCPCCGGKPLVVDVSTVKIACGKFGCKIVEGLTMKDAADLWNARDFRYPGHD